MSLTSPNKRTKYGESLIYGVGINDLKVNHVTTGYNVVVYPFYKKWHAMMTRAYSKNYHLKYPTYIGVNVCDQWLTFSKFKEWMVEQPWEGNHLDKDLLGDGKLYSPQTCIFVPSRINNLFTRKTNSFGLPTGVVKVGNRYRASMSIKNKSTYLGIFDTISEAECCYQVEKIKNVFLVIKGEESPIIEAVKYYCRKSPYFFLTGLV